MAPVGEISLASMGAIGLCNRIRGKVKRLIKIFRCWLSGGHTLVLAEGRNTKASFKSGKPKHMVWDKWVRNPRHNFPNGVMCEDCPYVAPASYLQGG